MEVRDEEAFADGQPIHLICLAGSADPLLPDDVPALRPLVECYQDQLRAAGHVETRARPYAFDRFDNGQPIPAQARRLYQDLGDGVRRFHDPFETRRPGSFWEWMNSETHPGSQVSRLWYRIYLSRPDLRHEFPDVFGTDRPAFLAWVREFGRPEYDLPAAGDRPDDRTASVSSGVPSVTIPGLSGERLGLNLAGYAMSEKGLGEALRATARAATAAEIPFCVVDFSDPGSTNLDRTLGDALQHNPYPINVVHVTAEQLPHFVRARGAEFLRGKYNIGFWMWELSDLPRAFHRSFGYLDEVWVASNYCLETIARVSPVPVLKIPLALPREGLPTKGVGRDYFGVPNEPTMFLFIFDVHSNVARKNPSGVIHAFKHAFPGNQDVCLVLKVLHGDWRFRRALEAEAADPRVRIIDRVFERSELNSLIEASDCYVSLHRSEGFGLTMVEAMALGKPVIATAYSANLDYMTPSNSFLVRYELARLQRDEGPYPQGSVWADPDVAHAAELMRWVHENPGAAGETAKRGRHDIWEYLSPAIVGTRIARRLALIEQRWTARALGPDGRR